MFFRIGSLFNPCHPLTKLQETDIDSYYAVLKDQVREMLGAMDSNYFHVPKEQVFEVDAQLISVREIAVRTIEDLKSGHAD